MTNVKAGEDVGRHAETWTVKETAAIMIEYTTLSDGQKLTKKLLTNSLTTF